MTDCCMGCKPCTVCPECQHNLECPMRHCLKKKEDSLRQRVDLPRETTQSVDQQAEFTRKVLQVEAKLEEVMSLIREVKQESMKMGLLSQEERPAVNNDRNNQRGGAKEDVNTPQFQPASSVAIKSSSGNDN